MHFEKFESVLSLIEGKLNSEKPRNVPIIYRWWFSEDSEPVRFLVKYVATHRDDCSIQQVLSSIETKEIDSIKYYALYLGKGINGRKRFNNHVSKRKRVSTLRRTISALLQTTDEDKISRVLHGCYFEWSEISCGKLELKETEKSAIQDGFYPLNIQDNPNIT